ncbi:hypothetical protein niasHT_010708 [Heterodera trifolii]|uniref:MAM domain-containing protein n=1 Tax=Heterodera trifolii TaxID=157864 RepID=A0ABD2L6M2_9BILA
MEALFCVNCDIIGGQQTTKAFPFYSLLLIIIICSSFCSACMPGYEQERSRLRQYLGVEWLPGGIEKMDVQSPRNVRHPSDLNCDFSKPELCKWRNVRSGGHDTLDFHLFRKEDNVEFPVVQVRPGPSKVAVGDQLLLTGDRKRDEQIALLASHPIKCQNTTGKLTFTFWLYNGARIEVLILEDREDEGLHELPEKPQIDCGTVQMNTECTVTIPPNLQPFQLGLRAYDIKNSEGSFVMLDNINYEAQFCKISIDFGPMISEHLLTGARGEFVNDMAELNCDQFGVTCRWRQSGTGKSIWKRATGTPPPAVMLLNETGTNIEPDLPSAFLYIEEGSGLISRNNLLDADTKPNEFRMLISDPIHCIGPSSIDLKFRIWSTKGIKLSVCLIEAESLNVHICHPIIPSLSPAQIQHNLQSTVLNFAIAFRIENVNIDFENFVIIDDIEVAGGDQCGDLAAKLENKLLDQFLPVPMLSSLLSRPIHSAQELSCDFSKRAIGCKWANPEGLAGDVNAWEIGVRKKQKDAANTLFDGDIALAQLHKNAPAYLVSETIQCVLQNDGTLKLRTWNNGNARLSVCIVRAHTMEILDCQNVEIEDSRTEQEVLVDIPTTDEPVKLLLHAEATTKPGNGQHQGQVAVDSIQFDAKICPSIPSASSFAVHGVQNTPLGSSPSVIPNSLQSDNSPHPVPDENVCRLLSCDFNNGESMCLYSSTRVSSSLSLFRAFNRSAFSMLFGRNRVTMIESSQFHLNAPARLHFDFSITKGSANMHVCQDSIVRELDTCLTIFEGGETLGWQHDFIELTENDRKVYIIARLGNGARKASVQIDNLIV